MTNMNNGAAKKIRREAKKLYTADVKNLATSQALDKKIRSFIKPKPFFWPLWFYKFMLRQLLNVPKHDKADKKA